MIPFGIKHLTFGDSFNQPLKIDIIPLSVTHLTFGMMFNQPLEIGMIPSSVTHLTFGMMFNQQLMKDVIPKNIIEIVFDEEYVKRHVFNNINNIIVGLKKKSSLCSNENYIIYENYFEIPFSKKQIMDNYIEKHLTKDKLVGNRILEDLCKKVCDPKRLSNLSEKYNLDVVDIIELYGY